MGTGACARKAAAGWPLSFRASVHCAAAAIPACAIAQRSGCHDGRPGNSRRSAPGIQPAGTEQRPRRRNRGAASGAMSPLSRDVADSQPRDTGLPALRVGTRRTSAPALGHCLQHTRRSFEPRPTVDRSRTRPVAGGPTTALAATAAAPSCGAKEMRHGRQEPQELQEGKQTEGGRQGREGAKGRGSGRTCGPSATLVTTDM